jgi:hypothetical protein
MQPCVASFVLSLVMHAGILLTKLLVIATIDFDLIFFFDGAFYFTVHFFFLALSSR